MVVVVVEVEVDLQAEVDHVQEVELRKGDPAPAVRVDHIHQRNPSPLQGHQRERDLLLQDVPDRVLARVHKHFQWFSFYVFFSLFFALKHRKAVTCSILLFILILWSCAFFTLP